ncbi:Hypothetical protein PHPALM_16938 [Phytophthora palmivora]|uniref:Uncharacterized protein n=1 Tax=Phytophthora palmivora TaxID=4796 RepID=A0A2P4XNJ1_9STRA|nr:Hypothetical protein PHPALM_16938 [Phytophthora palmivora]
MDLSKLWNNSTLNSLPSEVEALRSTLQRRLPRRVHLMDNRNDSAIFTEGCPEIRCDGLSTLINGYLMTCKAGSGMCNTSESLWQHFYDKLIDITVHICLSRGMRVNIMRNVEDPTGTSKKKKRPDVIIICNDMVVLRGEEKRAGVDIDIPSLELTTKMNPWSIMRYGQLPFILGYVTSGPRLQIVMINATNGELKVTEVLDINSIHMWNKSDAIKAFYNLAFIFEQMVVASRQALPTRWLPCRNRNRRLELVKISVGKPFTEPREIEVIQRTIKRKWYVVFHAFGTKIVAQLTPLGYHRQPDTEAEVYNWLHDMLTALRNWHACGYCHGDVCMENIVYIPSSTRGYWILIDMDKSHPPGARITWNDCRDAAEQTTWSILLIVLLLIAISNLIYDFTKVIVKLDTKVGQLRRIIASTRQVNVSANRLILYWVRDANLAFIENSHELDQFLRAEIDSGTLVEMQDCASVESFGIESTQPSKSVHIMVQVQFPSVDNIANVAPVPVPVPVPVENMRLHELPQYWERELFTEIDVNAILRHQLPFRVRIRDKSIADEIFTKDGPELRCDDLSSLIDALLMICEAEKNQVDTTSSWLNFDSHLFHFTSQICRAYGFHLNLQWRDMYEIGENGGKLQPDLIVSCNECVVLCGHGRTICTKDKLIASMEYLTPLFYGELPFVLGYCTSPNRMFYAYRHDSSRKQYYPVFDVSCAIAIKVFYNLAFVLCRMSTLSKLTIPPPLSPFQSYKSKLETIKIGTHVIQITLRRDRCADGREFKRIVDIYRKLKTLNRFSTGLQKVGKVEQAHFRSRKVMVQLSPLGYCRLPENTTEVYEWLQDILTALKRWHGSGYCHGDISWKNIVCCLPIIQAEPRKWMLVNMETSRKSDKMEKGSTDMHSCHQDLYRLGKLTEELHKTKFPLTNKLLWIRDSLLSACTRQVTAEKVLDMLHRLRNTSAENLNDFVSELLSALEAPKKTVDSVLASLNELLPPA